MQSLPPVGAKESDVARQVRQLSREKWGERRETVLVGCDRSILEVLEKLRCFAEAEGPVLVSGETGSG